MFLISVKNPLIASLLCVSCLSACHSSSSPAPVAKQEDPGSASTVTTGTMIQVACERRVDAGIIQGAVIRYISPTENTAIFCGDAKSETAKYELGSISKSFTGIELALQVLAGKVDLSLPISKYIRELEGSFVGSVNATQLATHTAQLVRDFPGDHLHYSESDLLNYLKAYKPDLKIFPAGQRTYSNLGFGTLGLLLSRVTGESFTDLIQKDILDALAMKDTVFMTSTLAPTGLVPGYDVLLQPATYFYLSDVATAWGGIVSNLPDMTIFLQANMLPDSSTLGKAITLSQTQGLDWDSLPGVHPIWKDGAMSDGYSTVIEVNPETKAGVMILGNELSSPSIVALGSIAMGAADTAVTDALSSDFLKQAVGTYKTSDASFEIDIEPVHQSFLAAQIKASGSILDYRLLSQAGSNVRFSVDTGLSSEDRIEFKDSGLVYLESNGKDASGQAAYKETQFKKQ